MDIQVWYSLRILAHRIWDLSCFRGDCTALTHPLKRWARIPRHYTYSKHGKQCTIINEQNIPKKQRKLDEKLVCFLLAWMIDKHVPWKSKTKQRMVFRMIHVKDSLLPRGKVWSLDFLGVHYYLKKCFVRVHQLITEMVAEYCTSTVDIHVDGRDFAPPGMYKTTDFWSINRIVCRAGLNFQYLTVQKRWHRYQKVGK